MQNLHPTHIPQQSWQRLVPKKYAIPSFIIQLSSSAVQWLLSDDTNPNCLQFPHYQQVAAGLKELKGYGFIKLAERSARDSAVLLRKVKTVEQLISLVKVSEYITQGVDYCHKNGLKTCLVIRQYIQAFEELQKQYKVYVKDEIVIGICQKHPNHIQNAPSQEVVLQIFELVDDISSAVAMVMPNWEDKELHSFVVDVCLTSGPLKITAITKFQVGQVSLFNEQDLQQFYKEQVVNGNKQSKFEENQGVWPLIKWVQKQQELKEKDMSEYKMGNEIVNEEMAKEWKNFVKESEQKLNKN